MNIYQRHKLASDLQTVMYNILWPVHRDEPNIVAQMVKVLPAEIKKALMSIFPGRQINVGGAFIHQKPLAHFINNPCPKSPELGDLLIVCREIRASGAVYNALLLQAKCVKDPIFAKVSKSDLHQFTLYSEWPEFEYRRAGALNGQRRNVLPKTITQGAQYLLIDKLNPSDMLTATVDNPLNGSKLFARTLASVLSFDMGRTYDKDPHDDWSQMIHDLLWLSANSVFNRQNAGFFNHNRWNGDAAFNFILNLGYQDAVFLDGIIHNMHDGPTIGMSVICVDLGSSQVID